MARKLLIVPGEYFFFGLDEDWSHRQMGAVFKT